MAASALLCESALIGSTLYLPATPPRSLTRSMAIWAPTEQAIEPPAANGPDRSETTPIRMVSAWALAKRPERLIAATVAADFLSSDRRDVVMAFLPDFTVSAGVFLL